MTLSKKIQDELREYLPGAILKSCDILGVVQSHQCLPNCEEEIIVEWETGQCYGYEREWLDCNTTVEGKQQETKDDY